MERKKYDFSNENGSGFPTVNYRIIIVVYVPKD